MKPQVKIIINPNDGLNGELAMALAAARRLRPVAGLLVLAFLLLCSSPSSWAQLYREQNPKATIGGTEVWLAGPPDFPRIDGLDRHLDDILLAAQSPAAAVLAIYAEPEAWKKFRDGLKDKAGLDCHAVISTPAPLAEGHISPDDFAGIKKDLATGLQAAIGRDRALDEALAGVSDHHLEKATSRLESFEILADEPDFITYRLGNLLELKFKDQSASSLNRSTAVISTLLLNGKILNLQLDSNLPDQTELDKTGRLWRESFLKANLRNSEH